MTTNATKCSYAGLNLLDILMAPACTCTECDAADKAVEAAKAVKVAKAAKRDSCRRCGGSGYIGSMRHVEGGRCFICN